MDLRFARISPGAATGTAIIAVHQDGSRGILIAPNANHCWTEADAEDAISALDEAPAGSVLVTNFGVPVFVVERAVKTARMRGFSVVLDPSPPERLSNDFFSQIDFITANAAEAGALTGIKVDSEAQAMQAAQALVARGNKTALVRRSDGGCAMAGENGVASIRPVAVEVVDKTGGGDAFAGALAVALIDKREALDAARCAVAAAHISVTRYGAQPSFPNRGQVEQMLARLAELENGKMKAES